jgi:hypothetical protein
MTDLAPHVRMSNLVNVPACSGVSRRTGLPCNQPALENGRCKFHGGKSPRGAANGMWKGERYVPSLPGGLMAAYEEAVSDPELLNITDEIALVQSRIHQLLEKLESQESFTRIKEIKTEWGNYKRALKREDTVAAGEAMRKLNHYIGEADHEYLVWEDLYKALGMRARLTKQEQKRRMEMHTLISTEEAISFVTEVMLVVKEHVTEDKVKAEIYNDVMKILERRPSMAGGMG